VVGVDERGQMVLPKEIRERSGIKPGDKLAVVTWEQGGGCPCILLIKTEELAGMVKNMLGPMLGEMGTK
jgi:AbrB family looped-hinge helix DNA binding protein